MDSKQVQTYTGYFCSGNVSIILDLSHVVCFFSSFWLMPAFMLKKIVLGNFAKGPVDPKMADAIDFMVDRVSISTVLIFYCVVDYIINVIYTIFDLPLVKCHKT